MMLRKLFIGDLFPEVKMEHLRQIHVTFILMDKKRIFYAQIISD